MSYNHIFSLTYSSHLHQNYQQLSHLPGFVLLRTGDPSRGRYDILSAYPYERIRRNFDLFSESNLITEIEEKIPKIQSNPPLDLPFQGGAIGFFSYDYAHHICQIKPKPQALWHSMPAMDMGIYDWAIVVDHALKKITLFSANTHKNTKSHIQEVLNLWYKVPKNPVDFCIQSDLTPLITKTEYAKAFDAIQSFLRKGRCYQANYTQPFHLAFSGNTWAIFEAIHRVNPVPYAAYLHYEEADILCFSPERFMTADNGELLASPIKGTKARGKNQKEDALFAEELSHCPKNRAENVMIVDLLRNDFGKIAMPGSVEVPALCALESYTAVHHLVSHIRAKTLSHISPLQAFLSCFPGGSITGAPKLEAMKIIAELEPYARGIYCGSIGYLSAHGRLDMNIAIRTLTAYNNCLQLAAGGALVIDSQMEDEYAECFTKLEGILKGL